MCNGSVNSIGIFNKSTAGIGTIGNSCSIVFATGDFINFGAGTCNIISTIGNNVFMNGSNGINFGFSNYNNGGAHHVIIGTNNGNQGGNCTVLIGQNNSGSSAYCNYANIGQNNTTSADNTVLLGMCNVASSVCTGAIGCGNTVGVTGAYVIGNSLTAEKTDTTHVENLIAFGQGASKRYGIGNVTSTQDVNWNDGNNQDMELIGSATLTFSNPIAGANYQLQITQGGVGSYTITWPSIKWQNATSPTLSTAVGAIDIISLYYDGTSYFGSYSFGFA